MRIAIDARKWRDYGIGTYVRNLLRHLARLDQATDYVVLCHQRDRSVADELGANFEAVTDASPGYSIREQLTIPLDLRRERIDLFHEPHYVLPPLTPCRSVVTIHDCIHLRFPQYLPNRLGYAYARTSMWIATHRANRVLTVSEASKRDILEYFHIPESKIDVIYNGIDERFWSPPDADDIDRIRERYQLDGRFVLYAGNIKPHKNLERLIDAFHTLCDSQWLRGRETADYWRRDLEVRDAAARGAQAQAAQARPVLRFRPGSDACRALPARRGVRLSVALRRLRPAAARGDGQRHAR